jgi:ParB family transcriptional regulator, chromosome partitioning protein
MQAVADRSMHLEFHQLDRRGEHLRVQRRDEQRRLLASLATSGQQVPIVVVTVANQPDRYLVIDGYQRIRALQQLGRDIVEAVIWPMSEAEALLLNRSMHASQHETALEQGWLLAELERCFGYSLEELARRFDHSVSWVSRRLALVELLPESVQQQVRAGELSAHIAMKYLVPVARASLEECQQLAAAFAQHKFTSRQAGALYAAWRDGSARIRQRILAQPELFLKAQQQVEPSPSVSAPAAELLRDLEMVLAIVNRASRRLRVAAPEMERCQCAQARRQINLALGQLGRMGERITQEQEHVEPGTADHDSGTAHAGSEQARDSAGAGNLSPDSAQSGAVQGRPGAGVAAPRESRALPATDSGTVEHLQGESRASP